MEKSPRTDEAKPLRAVGRVLDSRWMMGLSVAAVLVAIVWALLDKGPMTTQHVRTAASGGPATVELLSVPPDSEVFLDGRLISNTRCGVTPGTRHLLEVRDAAGQSWRQVFLADGSLSMIVEMRTYYTEVEAAQDEAPSED